VARSIARCAKKEPNNPPYDTRNAWGAPSPLLSPAPSTLTPDRLMAFIRTPWEALISWLARMEPSRREIFLAALALVLLFAVGTAGYVLLEGWSVADGFYMTFITLSTIGFQEVSPPVRCRSVFYLRARDHRHRDPQLRRRPLRPASPR
jgi:Ion channel.